MWRVVEVSPDDTTLEALERELRNHRSTDAAKELLSEVVSARAATAPLRHHTAPTARRDGARAVPSGSSGQSNPQMTDREAIVLRDLIGIEAERLARWGTAPGMPFDMEAEVFAAWETRLSSREDMNGRSIERLHQDRRWLEDYRRNG